MRLEALLDRASRSTGGLLERSLESELPHLKAEIVWAAEQEMALSLEDALVRRTGIFYRSRDNGLGIAAEAASLMAEALGWSEAGMRDQVESYRALGEKSRRWRGDSTTPVVPANRTEAALGPAPRSHK